MSSQNEMLVRTFAARFDPELPVVQTAHVNGVAVSNAWSCSYWDEKHQVGITAVAHGGQLVAYLEAQARSTKTADIADAFALALGCLTPPDGEDA